ncbi:MAG TPA: histidinol-phosphatase [candidate division Zixibacteria bacterium]|nr:histidinol-phosphatase [candidate division Zixibacteria bacterium]
MQKKADGSCQYTGVIHVHTTESDGTKSLEEVVAIGRETGLEFMLFSDHMNLNNREAGKEGFYGDTLVLIGYEHNDLDDCHHYLLFDSPRVYPKDMTAAQYVAAGAADGALGILAHPDEIREAIVEHPAYPWKDWSVRGYNGIELWNQMSEWMEKLTPSNKLIMAFSPRKSMVGPTDRILRKWDELNRSRKVVGIAGVDAHAFPIKVGPLTVEIFPYKVHFRSLRCYIALPEELSRDLDRARLQLYAAIRECRLYFANVRWGDAENFEFWCENSRRKVGSGGELNLEDGKTVIEVKTPEAARLNLVRNGESIFCEKTDHITYELSEPGLYRVEAWKGRRGWIFSNHIRVGGES